MLGKTNVKPAAVAGKANGEPYQHSGGLPPIAKSHNAQELNQILIAKPAFEHTRNRNDAKTFKRSAPEPSFKPFQIPNAVIGRDAYGGAEVCYKIPVAWTPLSCRR